MLSRTENSVTSVYKQMMSKEALTVWTVGHSNRPLEDFLELLTTHQIEAIADVRSFPSSRKYPYFNAEPLSRSLAAVGIEYFPFLDLGGRRRVRPDSHNTAWINESFRGYADFMETSDFPVGVERLLDIARRQSTAVMCAEAVWWRCHRSMIADELITRGVDVVHIVSVHKTMPHTYTAPARVVNGKLTYHEAE